MSKYWNTAYYSQPDASQIRKKSEASRKQAVKKGNILEPVIVQGRDIVKSWWGKAWCSNLEQYADYESRLDRGKRYVRTGAVIDLKIQKLASRVEEMLSNVDKPSRRIMEEVDVSGLFGVL